MVRAPFGPFFNARLARWKDYLRHSLSELVPPYREPGQTVIFPMREIIMVIRIFLIDEHRPAREILARRLASMPGLDIVGATCGGDEAIRGIEGLSPDVVLIDTKMKQSDGMDICRRALAADNNTTVAILTSYLDPDERRLAYQAGVDGYLLKDVDTDNLANWIKLAVGREPDDLGYSDDQDRGED